MSCSDLQNEAQADRILYKSIFGTKPTKRFGELPNILDLYVKNPANTNVVLWGERLLALWEVSQPASSLTALHTDTCVHTSWVKEPR